jgi:hypothetical protein
LDVDLCSRYWIYLPNLCIQISNLLGSLLNRSNCESI